MLKSGEGRAHTGRRPALQNALGVDGLHDFLSSCTADEPLRCAPQVGITQPITTLPGEFDQINR
jgi:hypothetical protein